MEHGTAGASADWQGKISVAASAEEAGASWLLLLLMAFEKGRQSLLSTSSPHLVLPSTLWQDLLEAGGLRSLGNSSEFQKTV